MGGPQANLRITRQAGGAATFIKMKIQRTGQLRPRGTRSVVQGPYHWQRGHDCQSSPTHDCGQILPYPVSRLGPPGISPVPTFVILLVLLPPSSSTALRVPFRIYVPMFHKFLNQMNFWTMLTFEGAGPPILTISKFGMKKVSF